MKKPMHYSFFSHNILIATVLLITSFNGFASNITSSLITFNDIKLSEPRAVEVVYLKANSLVPCRVYYYKNGLRTQKGAYNNEEGGCERIQKQMLINMKDAYNQINHSIAQRIISPDFSVIIEQGSSHLKLAENMSHIQLEHFTTYEVANQYVAFVKRQFPNIDLSIHYTPDWDIPYKILINKNLTQDKIEAALYNVKRLNIGDPKVIVNEVFQTATQYANELQLDWKRYAIASCFSENNKAAKAMAQCAGVVVDQNTFDVCLRGGLCIPDTIDIEKERAKLDILDEKAIFTVTNRDILGALSPCLDNNKNQKQQIECGLKEIITQEQAVVYQCTKASQDASGVVSCLAGKSISPEISLAIQCQSRFKGKSDEIAKCILQEQVGDKEAVALACLDDKNTKNCLVKQLVDDDLKNAFECYEKYDDYTATAACIAGGQLDANTQKALNCATQSTSWAEAAICNDVIDLDFTPEQQIALECAVSTGGEPTAFATCYGMKTTIRELTKCITNGVGGDGCFGKNNEIVKLATNQFNDITKGPGDGNEIVKLRESILKGDNGEVAHFIRNPGQYTVKVAEIAVATVTSNLHEGAKVVEKGAKRIVEETSKEVNKHVNNAIDDVTKGPGKNNEAVKAVKSVEKTFKKIFSCC